MKVKSPKNPKPVQASLNSLQRLFSQLKKCTSENERKIIQVEHKIVKVDHRKLTRYYNAVENKARDENLYKILSSNPSSLFRSIQESKRTRSGNIEKLLVGDQTFYGERVIDGFYESLLKLKSKNTEQLSNCKIFNDFSQRNQ